jgi:ribosomal protein S18 acetylase RimI-like enzyme
MITVRRLGSGDDLSAVLKLCKEFFAEYQDHHPEFFDTDNLSDGDISGRFRESIESETSATLIALDDGETVGYASLSVREQPQFYKVKRVGGISAIMVVPAHRRRGVGTMIMLEAKRYFREQGLKYYTFYTAVANEPAIKLYKKLGIEPLHMSFLGRT